MGEFEKLQYCHKAMLPLRQYLNFHTASSKQLQIHHFLNNGDNFWNIIYKINTMLNTNLVYISKYIRKWVNLKLQYQYFIKSYVTFKTVFKLRKAVSSFKFTHFLNNGDNFWNIIYKINTMLNTNLVYISKVNQEME